MNRKGSFLARLYFPLTVGDDVGAAVVGVEVGTEDGKAETDGAALDETHSPKQLSKSKSSLASLALIASTAHFESQLHQNPQSA